MLNTALILADATSTEASAAGASSVISVVKKACSSIYDTFAGIISALAVVCVAICLLGMLISKDERKVAEFKAWRNRIISAWLIFFALGLLLDFGQSITKELKGVSVFK